MKQVVDAAKALFMSSALSGNDASEAATYALDVVDWSATLHLQDPHSFPVVNDCLDAVAPTAGQYGTNARMIGEAVIKAKDQFKWNLWEGEGSPEPDLEAFKNRFAWCSLIGSHGPLISDKVEAGLTIQAPDVYYPPHAHQAVETYWILGGDGDWKVGSDPWFAVESGAVVHHESGIRHAMQTNHSALLTVWLWTSHLDSRLVFVRG